MMELLMKFGSTLFMGVSLIFLISPFLMYQFIHGDYERYVWIINGPFPFSNFGSGPFQLWMYAGLIFLGLICMVVSLGLSIATKRLTQDR